jgi:hypothetical protein
MIWLGHCKALKAKFKIGSENLTRSTSSKFPAPCSLNNLLDS